MIKVIETNPLKIFKSIRFRKKFYEGKKSKIVNGNLSYLRILYEGYDLEKGDVFDQKILAYSKAAFIKAELVNSELIVFERQLDEYKQRVGGDIAQKLQIHIFPEIKYEDLNSLLGKSFEKHIINLKLNLQTYGFNIPTKKMDHYIEYFDISIDHKILDNIIKTIEPI